MTADDKARLDALTPEVLRELAAFNRAVVALHRELVTSSSTSDSVRILAGIGVERGEQVAALCEAVGGAETAYRTWRFAIGDGAVYFDGVISADHGKHPTLAAALGAVPETTDA